MEPAIKPLTIKLSEGEYFHHNDACDGVCLECGTWTTGGCEPDARKRRCEACDARQVYGAEWALTMGRITIE